MPALIAKLPPRGAAQYAEMLMEFACRAYARKWLAIEDRGLQSVI